jgi:hypothetical protein
MSVRPVEEPPATRLDRLDPSSPEAKQLVQRALRAFRDDPTYAAEMVEAAKRLERGEPEPEPRYRCVQCGKPGCRAEVLLCPTCSLEIINGRLRESRSQAHAGTVRPDPDPD